MPTSRPTSTSPTRSTSERGRACGSKPTSGTSSTRPASSRGVTQYNRAGAISAAQLPLSRFFSGYNVNDFVNPQNNTGSGVPYNPIYGLPGASYRAGGGPGQSRAIGTIADRSAFSAANPNFGAYQDFRVIRLGVTLVF